MLLNDSICIQIVENGNHQMGCGMSETIFHVADEDLWMFGMTYNWLFITIGACVYEPGVPLEDITNGYMAPAPIDTTLVESPADLQPQGQSLTIFVVTVL